MFKNYFKVAFRNLWKNKIFSAINIIGLSIGLAASILIMLFVSYEKSFDNFHTRNLYRLNEVQKFEGMVAHQKVALSMFPMGPTLKNEVSRDQKLYQDKLAGKIPIDLPGKAGIPPESIFC
jgi:putative ABC transport system permease protein